MRHRPFFAVAIAGMFGGAVYLPLPLLSRAEAAPSRPRSSQSSARSSSQLVEARSHLRSGRIVQAEVVVRRALSAHDSAEGRLLLAEVQLAQGRLLGALEAAREAAALCESSGEQLAAAQSLIERLSADLPTVRLVGQLPEGAEVLLDGNALEGEGPQRLAHVDPGEHEVAVESPGRGRWRARFRVERGQVREVGVQAGPASSGVELPAKLKLPQTGAEPTSPFERASRGGLGWAGGLSLLGQPPMGGSTAALSSQMKLPGLRPDLRALGLRRSSGRVVLRDCTLVPCPAEASDRPASSSPASGSGDRPDKRLFSEVQQAAGVEVMSYNGFVMLTAPAEAVAHHARVGASMMPDGTRYVGLTGKW